MLKKLAAILVFAMCLMSLAGLLVVLPMALTVDDDVEQISAKYDR